MRLKVLVENTSVSPEYKAKHGICFYIETGAHKMLFDLGPNELFLRNAEKMGVDIAAVDTVVISHGHNDHGGALPLFLEKNHTAKVYMQEGAFDKHYTKVLGFYANVGIDATLKHHPQVVLTKDRAVMDDGLQLFSGVEAKELCSASNRALYTKRGGRIFPDDFSHEQNLVITEGDKRILIAGCSHAGIINIKREAERIIDGKLTHVIGGLHLYNPVTKKQESDALVQAIAGRLIGDDASYYTCHCTGQKAFGILKEGLSDRMCYLATGAVLEL